MLHYKFTMTNGITYQKQFSYDEFFIFEMVIAGCAVFTGLLIYALISACILYKKRLLHATYQIYLLSIVIKLVSWFILLAAYISAQSGYERISAKRMGAALSFISYFMLLIMIILLSKGYTVTRGKLPFRSKMTLILFIGVYLIAYSTAAIW